MTMVIEIEALLDGCGLRAEEPEGCAGVVERETPFREGCRGGLNIEESRVDTLHRRAHPCTWCEEGRLSYGLISEGQG